MLTEDLDRYSVPGLADLYRRDVPRLIATVRKLEEALREALSEWDYGKDVALDMERVRKALADYDLKEGARDGSNI